MAHDLDELKAQVGRWQADYDHARRMVREERGKLVEAEERLVHARAAQDVLQHVAEAVQVAAHRQVSAVVSRCLEAIFDEPYSFHIEFNRARGKTEAKLVFKRDELVLDDPSNEAGGGVIAVAAFALRLACLVLARPVGRRLIVADEPFRDVNGTEFQSRFRGMLLEVAKELKCQIVIASDDSWLQFGKVISL